MRIRVANSQQNAIALVIVLIVIVVLSVLAGGFSYSMKVETRLANQASAESELEWLGRSGVEIARFHLAKQFEKRSSDPTDNLKQIWAGGPGNVEIGMGDPNYPAQPGQQPGRAATGEGEPQDPAATVPFGDIQLGNGYISQIRIVDHERKFNINVEGLNMNVADQGGLLPRALMLIGVDAGLSPEIVDSIRDWIDRNDTEETSGAETDYYERLMPPYEAKNGWVDDMEELLQVRGMTPAILYGGSETNHEASAFGRNEKINLSSMDHTTFYAFGLTNFFTPLSSGRLNINTAPLESLMLIPGFDTNMAQAIITARNGPDGTEKTADDLPFRSPADVGRIIPQGLVPTMSRYCGVHSSVFTVYVTCQVGLTTRDYVAVLYRMNMRDIKILTMNWKPPEGMATEEAANPYQEY